MPGPLRALSCSGQGSLAQEPLPTPCPCFGGLRVFPLPCAGCGRGARWGHVLALRCWRWGQLAARAWPRAEPGCTRAKPACCGRRGEGIKSQPGPRGWCRPRDRQRARAGRELLALRQRGRGARRPGGGRELRAPRIVLPSARAAGPRHGQVWPRTWVRLLLYPEGFAILPGAGARPRGCGSRAQHRGPVADGQPPAAPGSPLPAGGSGLPHPTAGAAQVTPFWWLHLGAQLPGHRGPTGLWGAPEMGPGREARLGQLPRCPQAAMRGRGAKGHQDTSPRAGQHTEPIVCS